MRSIGKADVGIRGDFCRDGWRDVPLWPRGRVGRGFRLGGDRRILRMRGRGPRGTPLGSGLVLAGQRRGGIEGKEGKKEGGGVALRLVCVGFGWVYVRVTVGLAWPHGCGAWGNWVDRSACG